MKFRQRTHSEPPLTNVPLTASLSALLRVRELFCESSFGLCSLYGLSWTHLGLINYRLLRHIYRTYLTFCVKLTMMSTCSWNGPPALSVCTRHGSTGMYSSCYSNRYVCIIVSLAISVGITFCTAWLGQCRLALTVNLSADAEPIPGGYVVPERGNVTFTCNSSSSGTLFWTVDLRIPGRSEKLTSSAGLDLPQVRSPDTSTLANPASFTVHNVTSENNQSFVECSKEGSGMSNATLIVEGKGSMIMSTEYKAYNICIVPKPFHLGLGHVHLSVM